ncbi:cathepsin B [Acrasis kona]|uniref:Cathepsin B n=1 Tax=Acrasis kona TaxID=1008807 RepID=A0AAW2ZM10_9EUKA
MRSLIAITLLAIAAIAFAQRVDLSAPAVDHDMIHELNSDYRTTWEAGVNEVFVGKTLREIKDMLISRDFFEMDASIPEKRGFNLSLPESFHIDEKWPKCKHEIRDQARCGSCWAFAASEVLSDRFCIAGQDAGVLSPQYLVSCDTSDYGCQGGYLSNSWAFLVKTGIPTDKCYPYTSAAGKVDACKKTCQDGSEIKFYRAGNYYLTGSVQKTMEDILKNGPVEAGFSVYQDFIQYKKGVYQHRSGGLLGGHAVKVVGWGTEDNLDYWIVANSWTTTWGEKGYFKIVRGRNECNFEGQLITGLPSKD